MITAKELVKRKKKDVEQKNLMYPDKLPLSLLQQVLLQPLHSLLVLLHQLKLNPLKYILRGNP